MARLQQLYRDKIVAELQKGLGLENPMQVPKITRITVNMGVGEAVADKKAMDGAVSEQVVTFIAALETAIVQGTVELKPIVIS